MSLRLFEFEDQPWFPCILRDYQTGFLSAMGRFLRLYEGPSGILEPIEKGRIVDLASGAGLPAIAATRAMRKGEAALLLTDKYPHEGAVKAYQGADGLRYLAEPLDLLVDPLPVAEVYTMFNAFHHFSDAEQLLLIEKVKHTGGVLHVFEPLQPNVGTFCKVLVATAIGPLILSPFVRPFSWSQLFFTYVLPVGIVVTVWDGLVSVLRAPGPKRLARLKEACRRQGIECVYGVLKSTFTRTTYIRIQ